MFARSENTKNYYEKLGISSTATHEEIKNAYKKLALKLHPDKASISNIDSKQAEVLFKEVGEAYETLSNPSKRMHYDMDLKRETHIGHSGFCNNSCEEWDTQTVFNQFKRRKGEGFFKSNYRPEWCYSQFFGEERYNPNESNPPAPTAENRKIINHLITNDDVKSLDSYLNIHNFNNQSLLEELLLFATKHGCLKVVKYLVEERKMNPKLIITPSIMFPINGPLFKLAAGSGNLDLVKYLLEEHDADIESRAIPVCPGSTALSYAAEKGHLPIVEYLISKGADVNPSVKYNDIIYSTIDSGNVSVVKILIEAGTKLNDYHLSYAFKHGNFAISQLILQKRPGLLNHLSSTSPLAMCVIKGGNLDLLKYLERQENLDIISNDSDRFRKTTYIDLLCAGARCGNIDMMRYLLEEKNLLPECKKLESPSQYIEDIEAILIEVVQKSVDVKKVSMIDKLSMVRYLLEEKKFMLPLDRFYRIIKKADDSGIEMNAYLQSYLKNAFSEQKKNNEQDENTQSYHSYKGGR